MAVVKQETIDSNTGHLSQLSWGAIFAGLVVIMALSWLLYLLGAAVGVAVIDGTDVNLVSKGLGIGAVVWMVVSSVIAFFLGSMLTARLTGEPDKTVGMLHGVTVWGVASTLMLVLGYMGATTGLQTGYSVIKSTASAVGSGVSGAVSATGSLASSLGDTAVVDEIKVRLKQRASKMAAEMDAKGGANVSPADIRKAIDRLDGQTLEQIAMQLGKGNTEKARKTLADSTNLSSAEVTSLIDGLSRELQQELGTADNDAGLVADLENKVKSSLASQVADMDAAGGARVNRRDVRRALDELDKQSLQTIGTRLVQGDTQGAKNALAANTNLTDAQVNDLIDGVQADVQGTIDSVQATANDYVEKAATYTQAVLWSAFIVALLGLGACILGGLIGAQTARRVRVMATPGVHPRV